MPIQFISRSKNIRDKVIEEAKACGYVQTSFNNRKTSVPDIRSKTKTQKTLQNALRNNTIIQGTAADLIKVAMNNIHAKLKKGVSMGQR